MKAKLYLLLFALPCLSANAQNTAPDKSIFEHAYYFLYSSGPLAQCDGSGKPIDGAASLSIEPGVQFKITNFVDGTYVIHVLEAKKASKVVEDVQQFNAKYVYQQKAVQRRALVDGKSQEQNIAVNDPVYYLLSPATFSAACDVVLQHTTFSVGALTLPIKIRPGQKNSDGTYRDFTFESDISIGLSVGLKVNINRHNSFNFLGGIDITSVPVSPETTNKTVLTTTNVSAITWHAGVLFQIDNFQLGAFTGVDYPAGNTGRQWMYRNDMWLGVGLGYSLFAPKKTSDTQ